MNFSYFQILNLILLMVIIIGSLQMEAVVWCLKELINCLIGFS